MSSENRNQRSRRAQPTHPVTIVGRDQVPHTISTDDELDLVAVERTIGFNCSSGRRISGTWSGFPIIPLLELVGIPEGTTHLVIESTDEQRGCLTIQEAIRGLLAFERDGERLETPRFVASDIAGARAIKNVRRIETIELEPDEDRATYENFTLDSENPRERRT